MSFQAFDMIGQEIVENDIIVYPHGNGSTASLRIGRVKEKKITYNGERHRFFLRVEWLEGSWLPEKPTNIGITPDTKSHLLKVELDGFKQN
jgi:hypothetical protein